MNPPPDGHTAKVAIYKEVREYLRTRAKAEGVAFQSVLNAVAEASARVLRRDEGTNPLWMNGKGVAQVSKEAADTLNRERIVTWRYAGTYATVQNILAYKVVELCRRGNCTLESALRHLEQSSSLLS